MQILSLGRGALCAAAAAAAAFRLDLGKSWRALSLWLAGSWARPRYLRAKSRTCFTGQAGALARALGKGQCDWAKADREREETEE